MAHSTRALIVSVTAPLVGAAAVRLPHAAGGDGLPAARPTVPAPTEH